MATNSWTIIHVSNRRKKKEIDQKSLNNIEEHFNGELLKLTIFLLRVRVDVTSFVFFVQVVYFVSIFIRCFVYSFNDDE